MSVRSHVIPVPVKVESTPFENVSDVSPVLELRLRFVTAPSPETPVKDVSAFELRLRVASDGDVV